MEQDATPLLQLCFLEESLPYTQLLAIMLSPENPEMQDEIVAHLEWQQSRKLLSEFKDLEGGEKQILKEKMFQRELSVLDSTSQSKGKMISDKEFDNAQRFGAYTGEMLKFLLCANQSHPEHFSKAKAIFWAQHLEQTSGGRIENEREYRKAWDKYISAAHLWAAFGPNIFRTLEAGKPDAILLNRIALAEVYREMAESFSKPGAYALNDLEGMMISFKGLPEDVLERARDEAPVLTKGLSDEQLECIRQYKRKER